MTLPAGYMICVQTSENNGMVRLERILPGLSSADARMFHAIASDFTAAGPGAALGAGGDKFIQPKYLAWYRNKMMTQHPNVSAHIKDWYNSDMEFYTNAMCLILGEPSDYLRMRGIYVRRVDAVQLYYIEKQIDPVELPGVPQ